MRFLGIDYGTKKIGIALSDEGGTLAFPEAVLTNDSKLFSKLTETITKKDVAAIVVGESKNSVGNSNRVSGEIKKFIEELKGEFNLPVYTEQEFFTSVEARRYQGKNIVDDSAAALILQRYLDKHNK